MMVTSLNDNRGPTLRFDNVSLAGDTFMTKPPALEQKRTEDD